TLFLHFNGINIPKSGEIYIEGEKLKYDKESLLKARQKVGIVFQNPDNQFVGYNVLYDIAFGLENHLVPREEMRALIDEYIKKVDMADYLYREPETLSGGQKQRVAIARALAKDTPIIIADEPTGNLDSKSSKSIIKLLSEVSHDKLVIVVTHNYEQVEDYVTRKIKMHDGRVLEDKVIKKIDNDVKAEQTDYRNIRLFSKIRLGIRNTFNIVPKFLLLLSVFLFVTWALMIEYAAFKKLEYEESINGFNYLFNDTSDKRIIIKKNNKEAFTDNDYNDISNISNVDYVVKNDLLIDSSVGLNSSDYWLSGGVNLITNINKIEIGRMPSNDNEIVFETSTFLYSEEEIKKYILDKEFKLTSDYSGVSEEGMSLKIVGVKYNDNMFESTFYVSENTLNVFNIQVNRQYSDTKVLFKDNYYTMDTGNYVVPTYKVSPGYVYITEDMNYLCKNYNCVNQDIKIEVSNKYYKDSYTGKVKTYNKNNFKKLFGMNYDDLSGAFLVSM
ncbi:MAG: ABC transporter ATP-binding protein, partial [Bacilli bacterium]|nr:ABC transporter ATP-binding protein [Bacilli bacterium]